MANKDKGPGLHKPTVHAFYRAKQQFSMTTVGGTIDLKVGDSAPLKGLPEPYLAKLLKQGLIELVSEQ